MVWKVVLRWLVVDRTSGVGKEIMEEIRFNKNSAAAPIELTVLGTLIKA